MDSNKSKKNIQQSFGQTIKKLRLSKDMSQEGLALNSGMDLTSINEIERGHRNPMLTSIYKIASALEVKLSVLFENL